MSAPVAHDRISVTIDGRGVTVQRGRTILDAARAAGVAIPTLCHLDGLTPVGACRLCMVELRPSGRLVPACAVAAEEEMEVVTETPALRAMRRDVTELFFSERNHICAVCVANGRCELQDMARKVGVTEVDFDYRHPPCEVDASHAQFILDHNRCILCTRCVRVCDEVEGAHTWDVMGRGIDARIIADLNRPWGESVSCTSCGKCVQVCPTGALYRKGEAVGEKSRDRNFLAHLVDLREKRR
jgi:bidirectional [NiFe] hydrogenase diaphorase subunit